jgi:F-type H+-transporting ATPase subunit epsilon
MNGFTLVLQDATHTERIPDVISFVGEDTSGSFGILANHARFLTCLVIGLARFRLQEGSWNYLALPGAVLSFSDNVLTLTTRRYLVDQDYTRISEALQQQLLAEEEKLRAMKDSLRQMEENILKRLWQIGRKDQG